MTTDSQTNLTNLAGITTLRSCLEWAKEHKVAIGHFNISTLETLQAIVQAAKKLNVPVLIGVSEGEREHIGVDMCVAMVHSIRKTHNLPIFLNADHTYSFEKVKEAIDAGFDSVIIDAAKLSLEENIALTKKCVEYAKTVHEATGREILIEGELGYIGQSSKVIDAIPEGVGLDPESLTHADEVKEFVAATSIDIIAPAVGNIHGLIRGGNPKLNIERIREIAEQGGVPVVLHGASGITTEDLHDAVQAGVRVVHYNTELRVAFTDAVRKELQDKPDEVVPYKILAPGTDAVVRVVEEKLRVMNNMMV